jgi:RimJ/RimL family protein N-acetyltransferase
MRAARPIAARCVGIFVAAPDVRLETERLVLRLPRLSDFDGFAAMMADEETARYIGGHMERAAAWRKFLQMPGAWAVQGFGMFSLEEKASGEWIGQCGPWYPVGWPGTEVGWSLRREFTGKGYALEAATAAIDWAFGTLGWSEVIHSIQPPNAASIALAERLGSRYLGPGQLPPPYTEVEIGLWGQSREAWRARRAGARA